VAKSRWARAGSPRADAASPAPSQENQPPGSADRDCLKRCAATRFSPAVSAIVPAIRPGSALSGFRLAARERSANAAVGFVAWMLEASETSRTDRYGKPSTTTPVTIATAPAPRLTRRRRRWVVRGVDAATDSARGRIEANEPAIPRKPSAGALSAGISQNQSTDP
jgi:hypothetical protein